MPQSSSESSKLSAANLFVTVLVPAGFSGSVTIAEAGMADFFAASSFVLLSAFTDEGLPPRPVDS